MQTPYHTAFSLLHLRVESKGEREEVRSGWVLPLLIRSFSIDPAILLLLGTRRTHSLYVIRSLEFGAGDPALL